MADESKTSHSSPATWAVQEPTNSDSGDDPHPPPPTNTDGGYEAGEKDPEDQEPVREAKRRRICPSALDKCESIFIKSCCSDNSNCLTFSFDPKFSCGASTPEVTPKFGSFNLVAAAGISTEIQEKAAEEKEEEEEEEEEEEKDDEIKEKRNNNVLEVLGSTDGLSAD